MAMLAPPSRAGCMMHDAIHISAVATSKASPASELADPAKPRPRGDGPGRLKTPPPNFGFVTSF